MAGGLSMNLALGTLYGWSVFVKPLQGAEHWTLKQVSLTFTLSVAFLGLGTIMRHKPVAPAVMPEPPTKVDTGSVDTGKGNHCPGNSCSAPGQNKSDKGPKPDTPKGPKNK